MGWIFFLVLYKIRSLCENIREKKGHLLLGKRKVALERSSERSRESSNGSSNIQRHFNWCLTCWTSGILHSWYCKSTCVAEARMTTRNQSGTLGSHVTNGTDTGRGWTRARIGRAIIAKSCRSLNGVVSRFDCPQASDVVCDWWDGRILIPLKYSLSDDWVNIWDSFVYILCIICVGGYRRKVLLVTWGT